MIQHVQYKVQLQPIEILLHVSVCRVGATAMRNSKVKGKQYPIQKSTRVELVNKVLES